MIEGLLILIAILAVAILVLLILLFTRKEGRELVQLEDQISSLEKNSERTERGMKEEITKNREEATLQARQGREELANALKTFGDGLFSRITDISTMQKNQLDTFSTQLTRLTSSNEERLEKMRETIEQKLNLLQEDNSKKLEQMRATVDEKLHATLEKRLGESFKMVSERLEQVHKGLGEMQSLASSVGDLKKVLTNVKTRGTWGEVQLGNLLEQVLTDDQYAKNVATKKGSNDRVEFAIKLPGRDEGEGEVWLPIDAKFPQEDYQRLVDAQEKADLALVEESSRQIEVRIKNEAKSIKEKYLDPPNTTDFGIMFIPIEGLYAEVLRRPGLCDKIQREFRVVVTGPTTLAALLNSLQMGFRTIAIEKRSSEVWALLGAVKTEFGKFGDILDKTQKKLHEASNTIETAARKSRTIERKLRNVQELPAGEKEPLMEE
ncbi:MAG: DNA recombination protein RmuC [Deltaproteobacteria bacterium]|nr:DNA recombination protein RmuC [Deltaproteobacteria bacterium]